ncbi:MAG: 23S rRNA (guanosine(2251)-2'-O)-methyltransferase RlmB [Alphaproteobacteria bacterium]
MAGRNRDKNPSRPPGPDNGPGRSGPGRRGRRAGGTDWVWGRHAVEAALANPDRDCQRLALTAEALADLAPDLAGRAAHRDVVGRGEVTRLLPPGAVHQGIALLTGPPAAADLEDLIRASGPAAVLVALDKASDPQKVGAVLRSAASFGATGLILPDRQSPPLTGTVLKAASGAAERVPVARVVNLAQTLERLQATGFWCIGLDAAGAMPLDQAPLEGRVCLVLGAEGEGLRRLTRERCDALARIPMASGTESLNLAASAAVVLWECWRRRAAMTPG